MCRSDQSYTFMLLGGCSDPSAVWSDRPRAGHGVVSVQLTDQISRTYQPGEIISWPVLSLRLSKIRFDGDRLAI